MGRSRRGTVPIVQAGDSGGSPESDTAAAGPKQRPAAVDGCRPGCILPGPWLYWRIPTS